MSALLWVDTHRDVAIDLGVDGFDLYKVFAQMDHAVGGMAGFEELFGVIEASEIQDDVDPAWLLKVREQAGRFLVLHGQALGPHAWGVLRALASALEAPPA
jgi:hypothetical protein